MSLRYYLQLIRPGVTIAVTFSALASAIICSGSFSLSVFWPLTGIFLLAAGASALNQYQEWEFDEKMERTRVRPIPSRHLTTSDGLRMANICLIPGFIVLIFEGSLLLFGLGIFNVLWYNGVYTFLKRKTAFAVIPGALTGAIPVMMGWVAAGGNLGDPVLVFLSVFIFIWQMPHFWLIMMKYKDEYKKAGFPVLSDTFSPLMMKLTILAWLITASAITVYFSWFSIVKFVNLRYVLAGFNLLVVLLIAYQLFIPSKISFRLIFLVGNLYIFVVFVFLIIDKI
ncbi:MAG: protoheme IX farnesyltransferase [Bacteroidetes bacterium]|nr:protoheme IX farnesyltransferase [Bacteroidota bacterium]